MTLYSLTTIFHGLTLMASYVKLINIVSKMWGQFRNVWRILFQKYYSGECCFFLVFNRLPRELLWSIIMCILGRCSLSNDAPHYKFFFLRISTTICDYSLLTFLSGYTIPPLWENYFQIIDSSGYELFLVSIWRRLLIFFYTHFKNK